MQHFSNLRKTNLFLGHTCWMCIVLVTLTLITGSCATGKNQVPNFPDIGITAEPVPEGIRLHFSNISNIPPEIDTLVISFDEWVGN